MRTNELDKEVRPAGPSDRDVSRAWVSVALVPVFFVLALAVGEALVSAAGYDLGSSYPWWVSLVSDVAATVVLLAPCVAAFFFGRRAVRTGAPRGRLPAVLGAVLGIGAIGLTVVSELGNALR